MLKKEIKYTDFDGNETSDTFYFNITKSELVELEVEYEGGMSGFIQKIVKESDNHALIGHFKRIILLAYGQKSPDGKRFIKSDALREEFSQSAAYDELFITLATGSEEGANFIKGILPADIQQEMTQQGNNPTMLEQPNIQPAENIRNAGRAGGLPQPAPEGRVIQ